VKKSRKQVLGDHILVNKFLYGTKLPFSDGKVLALRKPEKEDIVVFRYPKDPKRDFIKRIVAVEGDVVESRNKKIFVNGRKVKDQWNRETTSGPA
jgi:signal peptidase I